MKLSTFVIKSETNRIKEGRPDLCWMDVPENKLKLAVYSGANYQLQYHHSENGVYICSYLYSVSARVLEESLNEHRNKTYKTYTKSPFYRFYLEFATGKIYTGYGKRDKLILKLPKKNPVRLGAYALEKAVEQASIEEGNFLVHLVASTAIWAPMDAVKAQKKEDIIRVRKKTGQKKGSHMGDYILDDNTYINGKIKGIVKKYLHFTIPAHEYHVCHIWPTSHEDPSYHSDIRNIVLLPSAIYSLSDHDNLVKAVLKYRAYKLFGNWTPGDEPVPSRPTGYEKIGWLDLLPILCK